MKPRIKQVAPFGDGSVPQKASPVAADRIALDDSASGFSKAWANLSAVLGNTGVELCFGAAVGAGDVGKYYQPHGDANGGKFNTLTEESQLSCPISGTIDALAWIADGNAVTPITNAVLKIWVNGLVVKTVTVSGAGTPTGGVSAGLNVPVAAGDFIAIEYDAVGTGTVFGKSALELFVRGV